MVLNFLKKVDYWSQIGDVEGFIAAVKQLGSDYTELDVQSNGYTKSDSIWGRLASLTQINKKETFNTRKWLYTTWRDDRRKVRTTFFSTQNTNLLPPENLNQSSNNDEIEKQSYVELVSFIFLISFLFKTNIVNNRK